MTRPRSTAASIANAVIYQLGWFACVMGAAQGWGTTGALVALALVLVHLSLATRPGEEWPLLLTAAGLGIGIDSLHAGLGVLDFAGHQAGSLAPLWVVALWIQFGSALHFSLGWLSRRYLLAAALGAVGGPMAFLGGERLGAAVFGEPRALSLGVLALSWSVALPLLVYVADRLGGEGRYRLPRFATRGSSGLPSRPTSASPAWQPAAVEVTIERPRGH